MKVNLLICVTKLQLKELYLHQLHAFLLQFTDYGFNWSVGVTMPRYVNLTAVYSVLRFDFPPGYAD